MENKPIGLYANCIFTLVKDNKSRQPTVNVPLTKSIFENMSEKEFRELLTNCLNREEYIELEKISVSIDAKIEPGLVYPQWYRDCRGKFYF